MGLDQEIVLSLLGLKIKKIGPSEKLVGKKTALNPDTTTLSA